MSSEIGAGRAEHIPERLAFPVAETAQLLGIGKTKTRERSTQESSVRFAGSVYRRSEKPDPGLHRVATRRGLARLQMGSHAYIASWPWRRRLGWLTWAVLEDVAALRTPTQMDGQRRLGQELSPRASG